MKNKFIRLFELDDQKEFTDRFILSTNNLKMVSTFTEFNSFIGGEFYKIEGKFIFIIDREITAEVSCLLRKKKDIDYLIDMINECNMINNINFINEVINDCIYDWGENVDVWKNF